MFCVWVFLWMSFRLVDVCTPQIFANPPKRFPYLFVYLNCCLHFLFFFFSLVRSWERSLPSPSSRLKSCKTFWHSPYTARPPEGSSGGAGLRRVLSLSVFDLSTYLPLSMYLSLFCLSLIYLLIFYLSLYIFICVLMCVSLCSSYRFLGHLASPSLPFRR